MYDDTIALKRALYYEPFQSKRLCTILYFTVALLFNDKTNEDQTIRVHLNYDLFVNHDII